MSGLITLNRRVLSLAWVLTGIGLVLAWGIDHWLESVQHHALVKLCVSAFILVPATYLVRRVSPRIGSWIAYFALVMVITIANLAFANPDLWSLFFVLGILRLVYRDSYLHLLSPILSLLLYGLVLWLNPAHRLYLSIADMVVRLFILASFHAMGFVINSAVADLRARPAKTALRLLAQFAMHGMRRRARRYRVKGGDSNLRNPQKDGRKLL